MYETKITSGTTEILSSGTIMNFNDSTIEIVIKLEGNFTLVVIFSFESDLSNDQARFTTSLIENSKLKITLFNFNSSLGIGLQKPMEIGNSLNRKLFLNFRVYSLDKSDNMLHFTVYRNFNEEAQNQ